MKRKFSFSLAPIKTSAQQEARDKSTQEPTPSHPQPSSHSYSHRRSVSIESVYDSSPFISRRCLDAQTERELRVACRLILKNFKPSDHGMENTDPKLDFGGLHKWKESKDSKPQRAEVKVRVPTGAPADMTGSSVDRKSSNRTRTRTKADNEVRARTQGDVPTQANTNQKRADFAWLDDRDEKREQKLRMYGRGPSVEMPRSATLKASADSGVSTPVTVTSTLAYKKSSSTAPASATVPPGMNSSRRPSQPENVVAVEALQSQVRPSTAARPPSRSESIRNGIKNYVISGTRSRTLSRKPSQDSLHTLGSVVSQSSSQDLQRSGSVSGWRNWVQRPRSRSTSRPGTANGQPEEPEQPKKPEHHVVDLNRELPPLPSLDTWKDPVLAKEETWKSPVSPISSHIASLMRPKEQRPERSTAARIQHGKSESDSPAAQNKHVHPVRKSSRRDLGSFTFPDSKRVNPYSPIVIDLASTGSSSTTNLDRMGSSTHTRQRSGGSLTSPSSPMGEMNLEAPANFSRKISTDLTSRGPVFVNEVNISKKEDQKSKLKKVFSGWMNKKSKKDGWMEKIEKGGVKEGVMQESSNATTVVRY